MHKIATLRRAAALFRPLTPLPLTSLTPRPSIPQMWLDHSNPMWLNQTRAKWWMNPYIISSSSSMFNPLSTTQCRFRRRKSGNDPTPSITSDLFKEIIEDFHINMKATLEKVGYKKFNKKVKSKGLKGKIHGMRNILAEMNGLESSMESVGEKITEVRKDIAKGADGLKSLLAEREKKLKDLGGDLDIKEKKAAVAVIEIRRDWRDVLCHEITDQMGEEMVPKERFDILTEELRKAKAAVEDPFRRPEKPKPPPPPPGIGESNPDSKNGHNAAGHNADSSHGKGDAAGHNAYSSPVKGEGDDVVLSLLVHMMRVIEVLSMVLSRDEKSEEENEEHGKEESKEK